VPIRAASRPKQTAIHRSIRASPSAMCKGSWLDDDLSS